MSAETIYDAVFDPWRLPDDVRRAAALVACDRAHDVDDARLLLAVLDLLPLADAEYQAPTASLTRGPMGVFGRPDRQPTTRARETS